jgi:hypothetical protein
MDFGGAKRARPCLDPAEERCTVFGIRVIGVLVEIRQIQDLQLR